VLPLHLGGDQKRPLDLLCIGAHSDDIEIGCGGTILRILHECPGSRVHWIVLSATALREEEARRSADAFLTEAAETHIEVQHFRESYFPYMGSEIKDFFNDLGRRVEPDLVLCHHRSDEHQDHRLVAQLVWNTFRSHAIAEYEIPKYEGDLGQPNVYVTLSESDATRKIRLISEHFESQKNKHWFRPATFEAMMTIRGVEAGTLFAEAFHVRKLVI
jgi:LmbE family N-acetylglucosaminyl deacetylase